MAKAGRGDFDGKDGYLYYATSPYLLYWLQEQGLLRRFYAAYRESARRDPEGLETLRRVSSLRIEWEAFVRGLVYTRHTRPRS